MVLVKVGDDEQVKALDAARADGRGHVLAVAVFARVDEDGHFAVVEQNGVGLAHVEEHRRQFARGLAPGAAGEQQAERDERAEQFAHACLLGYRRAGGAQGNRRPGKRLGIYRASAAPLS